MPYTPFCTSYTALEVTGSTYPGVNGIYYPVAQKEGNLELDIWCKNDVNDLIRITNTSGTAWTISYRAGLGPSDAPLFFNVSAATCPPLGVYTVGAFGEGSEPTVSEYVVQPSEPTFGLPAETVALITSRFGTVANFLRLRNQGQV